MMRRFREDGRAARYLDDPEYRTRVNLYLGTAVNAAYIIIKLVSGVALRSGWLIAFALYYAVLTVLRASLAHYLRRNEPKADIRAEYRRYRTTGVLLLGLNGALSVIISRMIANDDAAVYPGVLIYAMATYTFYAAVMAVLGLLRFRRRGSPVLSAVKAVNLAAAVMALIGLEAAMLRQFGAGDDGLFRYIMLGVSGLGASLILLAMSAYMIANASRELKRMRETKNE